ncbi:MAG: DUF3857 domain-containing protein [Flavihumibacter sp.]
MKYPGIVMLFSLSVLHSTLVFSQEDADTKKLAEEVRKEVWSWNIPAFNNREIPAAYATEPAVVMARHHEIKAISKNKFKFRGLSAAKYKEIYFTNTFREMVKINDKATLEEFSEFSYQKSKKLAKFFSPKLKGRLVFLGVRIIKPDGSIKEVNVDEEVLTKDENSEQRSKVAIPGLEVGDIIDYFFCQQEEEAIAGYKTEPYLFIFGDDKPVLHYSVHCEAGPTCAVEYRAMNGAPEFSVKKDADDDNILDAEYKNIAKAPVGLWMSAARQLPILRLNIRVGGPRKIRRKEGEVYRNQPYQQIIEDVKVDMKEDFYGSSLGLMADALTDEIKSMIRRARKNDDLPKDSLPYYAYYAFRYIAFYRVTANSQINVGIERNYQTPNKKKFLELLSLVLNNLHIENKIILATSRYGPDTKQVLLVDDFEYIIKTLGNQPVYMCAEGVFTNANFVPAEYEGQDNQALTTHGSGKAVMKLNDELPEKIATTKAGSNMQREHIEAAIDSDMEKLNIDRQSTLTGELRYGAQRALLLFEDYYEEERKALSIKESFMETFADSRRNRSLADEYKVAFAKARTAWKDQFMNEIETEYGEKPKELSLYRVDNMGLRHTRPDLVYSTRFQMEGWVKKGGANYIVDIGKLIGTQTSLKPDQKERKVDIYMSCARSFQYTIRFEVPQGYKAEGVDKLPVQKVNAAGAFQVDAKQEGNSILLTVTKTYNAAYEPVSHWPQLVEIIEAAHDFEAAKILLRKG